MKQQRNHGFTLIELLTVIAIIAILTAITSVALPRMIEKARLTSLDGTFRGIEIAMTQYFADHSSFPPAYGFIDFTARQKQIKDNTNQIPDEEWEYYHLRPYLSYLRLHGNEDVHDTFGESYDVNRDGIINLYEFSPVGTRDITVDRPTFNNENYKKRYNGSNYPPEVTAQFAKDSHPLIYIPVNQSQFKRAQRYWLNNQDFHARTWDGNAAGLADISFPPSKYDAYVLISIGPREDLSGVVPEFRNGVTNINARDLFHIQALRAYFLATRDMNQNNRLDYDFFARTRDGEGGVGVYQYKGADVTNELPAYMQNGQLNPDRKELHGPIIKKYGI